MEEEPPDDDEGTDCDADISQDEGTTEGTLTEDDSISKSELMLLSMKLQRLLEGGNVEQGTRMLRNLVSSLQSPVGDGKSGSEESSSSQSNLKVPASTDALEEAGPQSKWASPDAAKLCSLGTELRYIEPEVHNGVAVARITSADVSMEIAYWETSVYCHILGAQPPFSVVNGYIRRTWKDRKCCVWIQVCIW